MTRQLILPRAELAPYVRNVMIGGFDGLSVHLPATPDVQLLVYLRGGAYLLDEMAVERRMPLAFIAGASFAPRLFRVEPGSRFAAVTFRPAGLLACCGLPAHALAGQLVPLAEVLAHGEAGRLLDHMARAKEVHELVAALEAFLLRGLLGRRNLQPVLPGFSLESVLLPAAELADRLGIGQRQLERRFLAGYGMPLRDYRRLARFSAALGRLLQSPARPDSFSRIAQDARYVDQAHFARDFRQFVGATPGQFLKARQQPESIYRFWQLTADELSTYLE